jgi:hypothetical protein
LMPWILLWQRIKAWWAALNRDKNAEALASLAAQLDEWAKKEAKRDWFAWEGEQYAQCPSAFWFDHWRYANSDFEYPEPTQAQRRANWDASFKRMVEKHGKERMDEIATAMAEALGEDVAFTKAFKHAMAPWERVVAEYKSREAFHWRYLRGGK